MEVARAEKAPLASDAERPADRANGALRAANVVSSSSTRSIRLPV